MSKRYRLMYKFFNTEKEAIAYCDRANRLASEYIRKYKPARYTPHKWKLEENGEKTVYDWVVFYYVWLGT